MTIRVAILDERLPEQMRENPAVLEGIEVVWAGTDAHELERMTAALATDVLVVNLELLPGDPAGRYRQLVERSGAELAIGLYTFAPREILDQVTSERSRAVKSPLSLQRLRAQMMSVIVRDLLGSESKAGKGAREATSVKSTPAPTPIRVDRARSPSDAAPRFTSAQLGRLLERRSAIACECPNHVAELVSNLLSFERYSRDCQNKNEADATMHALLAEATGRARRTMEDALVELLAFEKIVV
jgi:hypothetical protein